MCAGAGAINGRHPVQPWVAGELGRVLEALAPMADDATPPPDALAITEDTGEGFSSWKCLAAGHPVDGA